MRTFLSLTTITTIDRIVGSGTETIANIFFASRTVHDDTPMIGADQTDYGRAN
jgi:hypothetical protein